jgi:voltage-gated potassium channel Kch
MAWLEQGEGRHLQNVGRFLIAWDFSRVLTMNSPDSVQRYISLLEAARPKAPQEARPVLDLQIGIDRAVLARLYQQANNPAGAATQRELARPLLRDLGWKDTSDDVLNQLADQRLNSSLECPAK